MGSFSQLLSKNFLVFGAGKVWLRFCTNIIHSNVMQSTTRALMAVPMDIGNFLLAADLPLMRSYGYSH